MSPSTPILRYHAGMMSHGFSMKHMVRVVLAIGWADFKMKYRGSIMGVLWSLIYPLVKYVVILHIFRRIVTDIPLYSLYLFLGILLWEHFAMTSTACMTMLQEKAAIIQKVRFPRLLLIFGVGWTHVLILCGYLVIFFIAQLLAGAQLTLGALYLPVLITEATLLALGIGMLLSAFSLRFRDIPYLWNVLLQVLFWLTPILYAFEPRRPLAQDIVHTFTENIGLSLWSLLDIFIRFQPLSILLFDARRALLYAAETGIPTPLHTLGFLLFCAAVFLSGAAIFQWRSRYFLQEY
jgi:ABC-type polysaccharide/polyol phosphate export permease